MPDALDLAVRLLARQAKRENVVITGTENVVITPAAPVVCFSCWGSDFWRGLGVVVCRRCHPPAPGAELGGAA